MKRSILILFLIALTTLTQAQSKIIEQLKLNDKSDVSLYFYPSTLRMINLQKNEEFNELVKDIKKMTFLKLDRRKFDPEIFMRTIVDLQQKEKMEEYIVVDGSDQKLYLLGREIPTSTIAMAYFQGDYYAIDIAGSISIAELPKLYEKLSQNDSTLRNDFGNIFDLVSKSSNFMDEDNHRRRERNRD